MKFILIALVLSCFGNFENSQNRLLGKKCFNSGDYEGAIHYFSRYKQTYWTSAFNENVQMDLGKAYYMNGDYDKAWELFSRCVNPRSCKDSKDICTKLFLEYVVPKYELDILGRAEEDFPRVASTCQLNFESEVVQKRTYGNISLFFENKIYTGYVIY